MKILICILALVVSQYSFAQTAEESILQVLKHKTNFSQGVDIPENTQFHFDFYLSKEPVTDSQLNQLRESAKSDPTAAVKLERALSENAAGGVRREVRLFYGNESQWRTCNDLLVYSLNPSVDMAQNGKQGYWIMSGRQLQLANEASSDFNPSYYIKLCRSWITVLTSGVVWDAQSEILIEHLALRDSAAHVQIRVADKTYTVTLIHPEGASENDWSNAWIQQVQLLETNSGEVMATALFDDWELHDSFNKPIARKQTILGRGGTTESELTLISIGRLDFNIDKLTQTPTADGADVLRGPNTFTSIKDYTSNNQTTIDFDSRDILQVVRKNEDRSLINKFTIGLLIVLGATGVVHVIIRSTR